MVSMGCGPSTGQPSGSGSTGASPERASTTTAVGASETTVGGGGTVDGADSTDVGDESPADGTTDGGTTEGPPQWVCSEDSFDFACTADQQSTLLEGMTPLGLVSLSLSYAGVISCGQCLPSAPRLFAMTIVAVDSIDELPRTIDRLEQGLVMEHTVLNAVGAPQQVPLQLRLGQQVESTTGTLTFDAVPTIEQLTGPTSVAVTPRWSGTLTIKGDGWDVEGPFEALACGALMTAMPCD